MNYIQELEQIGLTEKEARVYLAALELGENAVQVIAQKAGVNRATTYFILESLIQKGLCSTITREKKVFFLASAPEQLDALFNAKKREIDEQQKNFKKFLPGLKLLSDIEQEKPSVKFFEGKEGAKNCNAEFWAKLTKTDEPMRMIYNRDKLVETFTEKERESMKDLRIKLGVKAKSMYVWSEGDMPTVVHAERKRISGEENPIDIDLAIYQDKVRIASYGKKLVALLIRDKAIAESLKTVFEMAWRGADKK